MPALLFGNNRTERISAEPRKLSQAGHPLYLLGAAQRQTALPEGLNTHMQNQS